MAKAAKSGRAKSGGKGGAEADSAFMEALKEWVRARGPEFLKDPNITSVGIGYKESEGKRTDELAVQFTVAQKVQPEALDELDTTPIPESFTIGGVEVPSDVIQRDFTVDYRVVADTVPSDRKVRCDPIAPGVSVANVHETAGTLGCIVFDAVDGAPYILSNWHVLHGPEGAIGDEIVQPGPFDDNRTHLNHLGKLVRSHLGPAGDCAIASIEGRGFGHEVVELGGRVEQLGEPEIGDKVVKSGRTTGVTHGIVTRVHTMVKLDYGGEVGEQVVGGFEIVVDPDHEPADGEVSKGGDSGSAWLFKGRTGKPNGIMAGLHFAGEAAGDPNEHAVACYPKSVFTKLGIALKAPEIAAPAQTIGYSPVFLSERVELPKLGAAVAPKAFTLDGSEVIGYTHFSLALNTERTFAFWVAWNVDGGGLRRLSRKGIPFVRDPRVPAEFQAGDELYAGNRLDRGHLARRADLLWGGPAEAKRANVDSFFFTNITPQMDDFNQSVRGGLWGRLEDAVFADVDVDDLKVSVFGGPVFRDDDRIFRGVKIPREFWKAIAFVEGGKLKAKGFLLTQNLDQIEALELDEFRVFQVALIEIESRCNLIFPAALKGADAIGERLARQPEAAAERPPLGSLAEIDWS